ncbi:MAG: WecB/TagA/CpsF family glycosyltransferase [Methanothrix sp.]|nr:WecB/TagA/CpsF family glycosyltransferase [Methanothrix sp.]
MSRTAIMGCPVDSLSMDETIERIEDYIKQEKICQHVVINVAKLVEMHKDPELRRIINECDLINVDGMPIVWASRILGQPIPERVAGVDLFQHLVKLCAEKGYRPYFFGAKDEVVEKVVETFMKKYPNLHVAGYRNGYFSKAEELGIAEKIRDSKADMLFVAFSSPMKENFLKKWMPVMKVPFCMGVGGSFDIVAGKTKRAPLWMQESGLEWLYRIYQEPRRMWKRYAKTNPIFIWMVLKEYVSLKIKRK